MSLNGKLVRAALLGLLTGAAIAVTAWGSAGAQESGVYDVGTVGSCFHEYTSKEALVAAMTNPLVEPPCALEWYDADADGAGYWAGPGYDPAYVGYPEDITAQ